MGKLTSEQKAYIASLDSKKKRKKQKKAFRIENIDNMLLNLLDNIFKEQESDLKKEDTKIKLNFELTPDKLREITEPKKDILDYDSINLDTFNGTLSEYISVLIENIPNDMDLGSEIRRIFK